uniref:Uncharacterized protein n=1 Tax=Halalkalibacterium halodurans TaxID=86665 RepID=A0A0M0KG38_ALKHA
MGRVNKKIIGMSMIIPLLHVVFFPPSRISSTGISEYAMGFPFHFIWYRDFDGFVSNKLLLFTPTEFLKTEINLVYYFLSIVLIYLVLYLCFKLSRRITPFNIKAQKH